jgi:hypothetical protein
MVDDQQTGIKIAIGYALDYVETHSIRLTPYIADRAVMLGIKTADFYNRVLMTWVNDLYTKEVSEGEFVDKLAEVIDQQLTRAFNEGMRLNELDPSEITDEQFAMLQEIIAQEYTFVDGFAADIASGNYTLPQLQARAGIWSNRYNDVVNQAKLETADLKDKYEWIYGDTQHCDTCSQLNGLVATAKEWEIAGIKPQSPPNDRLSCGGWKCQCKLEPTTKRRSPKVLDTLLTIGAGG